MNRLCVLVMGLGLFAGSLACTSARDPNDPNEMQPAYTGEEFEGREVLREDVPDATLKLNREQMDQQSSTINNRKTITEDGVDRTSTTPPELQNQYNVEPNNFGVPPAVSDSLQRVRP